MAARQRSSTPTVQRRVSAAAGRPRAGLGVTARMAGSGSSANASPRRGDASVSTTCGPAGGPDPPLRRRGTEEHDRRPAVGGGEVCRPGVGGDRQMGVLDDAGELAEAQLAGQDTVDRESRARGDGERVIPLPGSPRENDVESAVLERPRHLPEPLDRPLVTAGTLRRGRSQGPRRRPGQPAAVRGGRAGFLESACVLLPSQETHHGISAPRYSSGFAVQIEDRGLANLKIVILSEVRKGRGVAFRCSHACVHRLGSAERCDLDGRRAMIRECERCVRPMWMPSQSPR